MKRLQRAGKRQRTAGWETLMLYLFSSKRGYNPISVWQSLNGTHDTLNMPGPWIYKHLFRLVFISKEGWVSQASLSHNDMGLSLFSCRFYLRHKMIFLMCAKTRVAPTVKNFFFFFTKSTFSYNSLIVSTRPLRKWQLARRWIITEP